MKTLPISRASTGWRGTVQPCWNAYITRTFKTTHGLRFEWAIDIYSYDAFHEALKEDLILSADGSITIYDDYVE